MVDVDRFRVDDFFFDCFFFFFEPASFVEADFVDDFFEDRLEFEDVDFFAAADLFFVVLLFFVPPDPAAAFDFFAVAVFFLVVFFRDDVPLAAAEVFFFFVFFADEERDVEDDLDFVFFEAPVFFDFVVLRGADFFRDGGFAAVFLRVVDFEPRLDFPVDFLATFAALLHEVHVSHCRTTTYEHRGRKPGYRMFQRPNGQRPGIGSGAMIATG